MRPPDFSALFVEGKEIETEIGRVVLRQRGAGGLTLTSGRVVACDPSDLAGAQPFTRAAPVGTFPVTLSVAHFDDGDRRVAGALVRFREGEVARWELALRPGEDASDLGEGEIFGYGVDSAAGCFIDEETARLVFEHADEEEFADALAAEMERTYEDTWSWANVEFDPDAGSNIVAFSTGVGDGLYASYFGLDAAGEAVCLVTDFSLFEYDQLA